MKLHKQKHSKLAEESGQTQATSRIDHAFASGGSSSRKSSSQLPEETPKTQADRSLLSVKLPKRKKFDVSRKKKKAILGLVLLTVIIGGFVYYRSNNKDQPAVITGGCANGILQTAIAEFPPERLDYLHEVVHEIEQISDYEQDPDCLYVLIQYAINTSDGAKAEEILAKLESVYNADEGYDRALVIARAKTPEQLRPIVSFLKQQSEQQFSPTGNPL